MLYRISEDHNVDYECPKATKFNTSNVIMNMNMHFSEKEFEITYYTYLDIFTSIGGINSNF